MMSPVEPPITESGTAGTRLPCVFLHGWGMNSAVWQPCRTWLPDWIDAIFVDLPGHGRMREVAAGSLDDYVHAVAAVVSRPALWVGWSMGGLVALRLAQMYPQKTAALLLTASTPCFVQREGWPHAVKSEVFAQFAELLLSDVEQTLKRFFALQSLGAEGARQAIQDLQQSVIGRGVPTESTLQLGLEILQHSDMRAQLGDIAVPLGFLLAERDVLVPAAVAQDLRALAPAAWLQIMPRCGHTPMVSQPQAFVAHLQDFAGAVWR